MGIATSTLSAAQSKLNVAAPYLIEQDWVAYTPEQHAIWSELVSRCMPQLRKHAAREYLDGFDIIGLERRPPAQPRRHQRAPRPAHRLEFDARQRFPSRARIF